MSFSRLIQWYHTHVDPVWLDGTYKLHSNTVIGRILSTLPRSYCTTFLAISYRVAVSLIMNNQTFKKVSRDKRIYFILELCLQFNRTQLQCSTLQPNIFKSITNFNQKEKTC
jgi:hypothetical protein